MLAAGFCTVMMVMMVWMMVAPMAHGHRKASRDASRGDEDSHASS
jgi:hypothetical protein